MAFSFLLVVSLILPRRARRPQTNRTDAPDFRSAKQVRKYRDGARKVLDKTDYKNWPIEIIRLVGEPPPEYKDAIGTGPKGVAEALKNVDARIVFYDQLLDSAQQAYAEYLEAHKKKDKLWGVFAAIDNFSPPLKDDQEADD
jgi:hypothetical protein